MAEDCTGASMVVAFDHAWLSTKSGYASKSTSSAVPSRGNRVVLLVTVVNISASSTLDLYLDSSLDGRTWIELGTVTQSTFGNNTLAQGSVDGAFVRARAQLSGTLVDALINVTLAFSCQ